MLAWLDVFMKIRAGTINPGINKSLRRFRSEMPRGLPKEPRPN